MSPSLSQSGIRLNRILGKIIPILMFTFMFLGSQRVLKEVCPYIIYHLKLSSFGRIYQAGFSFLFTIVIALYLWIYFQPLSHSSPSRQINQSIKQKLIVYESSDHLGTPSVCELCGEGCLKPLRSRHCLDCGTCKTGFDHHCVWFDQCLTFTTTLKAFIQVIFLGELLILLGALPVLPIVRDQVLEVVRLTWANGPSGRFLRTIWWDRWWGWAGGPGWRYAGGLLLGYHHYHWLRDQYEPKNTFTRDKIQIEPYQSLLQPTLSTLLLLTFAILVFLIAFALLAIVFHHTILHGRLTIDVERSKRWRSRPSGWDPRLKLWVPDPARPGNGKVVRLETDEDVFDNGPMKNFKLLMGHRVWEWFVPWSSDSNNLGVRGVEWSISPEWMQKLREREPLEAVET